MIVFHIVAPEAWTAAEAAGEYLPAAFDHDSFVHFSFAHQVARVANARYRDAPELIVVAVDSDEVPAPLRVEDSYDAGEEFPHLYGPIPVAAARSTYRLERDDHGDWTFTRDRAGGSASTDR